MTKFFDTLMAFSFGLPVFFPFWLLGLLIRSFYCLFHRCLSSTICLLLYFFYFNSIKLSLSWNENGEITKREIGKIVFVFFVSIFSHPNIPQYQSKVPNSNYYHIKIIIIIIIIITKMTMDKMIIIIIIIIIILAERSRLLIFKQ